MDLILTCHNFFGLRCVKVVLMFSQKPEKNANYFYISVYYKDLHTCKKIVIKTVQHYCQWLLLDVYIFSSCKNKMAAI